MAKHVKFDTWPPVQFLYRESSQERKDKQYWTLHMLDIEREKLRALVRYTEIEHEEYTIVQFAKNATKDETKKKYKKHSKQVTSRKNKRNSQYITENHEFLPIYQKQKKTLEHLLMQTNDMQSKQGG